MGSIRQNVLQLFYPLLMKAGNLGVRHMILENKKHQRFQTPIFDVPVVLNNGTALAMRQWQGKKLLIVNTASNCGYTSQYAELQQLQDQYPQQLQVLGFPSNDFKNQEPGSDAAIAQFCQVNFGVTFPLMQKSSVLKGAHQHPVYQWLTQPEKNGWNSKAPGWNFSKYLVDEQGVLTHYFDAAVSPLEKEVRTAVET
jgi:glutathione peroxidase